MQQDYLVLHCFWRKKNKLLNLRRNLFVRNGGELLQKTVSIFTAEDLNKAIHNYDENNVLSQEHYHLGITYRGMLHDVLNQTVTIKFCHGFERCNNIEVLIRKLVSLSQISHRNVVKLLGCCLERRVPLVVYEFFTAKTLLDYLTDDYLARSLSWDIRLRIAADAAGALAHMHSATSVPIIHGSLNSFSILVDHGYTVKLQGFSLTCSECSCVQFYGELLTGKDVMSPEWLEGEENLAKYFDGSSRGGDLPGILDDRVVTDDNRVQLTQVAEIAQRCLSSSSQERPTMKEVAAALECIKIREFQAVGNCS
ncbi:hypothetical protein C2S51_019402 [Perilla frutescens var. frutescens]|nr:hypothetical protein C2S51_019402 [Perilla frutescens var. frutescens]